MSEKKWTDESAKNLIRAIFESCPKCSNTGVIAGLTFNSEDKATWEDWLYCTCEHGIRYRKQNQEEK